MSLSNEKLQELLFQMLRIRLVQKKIEAHYLENEMKTPIHLYNGQEAIAVGVCSNLNPDDYINSNHRSHGHYLAKGGNLKGLIAELFCRETGCSKGRGGSMHLIDTSVGHLGSSSIVGGGIPIGTGLGMAIKFQKQSRVSLVFFSDGAADEGVIYESFNYAMLKKLPVVFVFENNQYSVCSHVSSRQALDNIYHKAPPELMFTRMVDGNDVLEVREISKIAVDRARKNLGPSFLECKTYRVLGHAGAESQDAKGYRPVEEIDLWKAKCPIESYKQRLLIDGKISLERVNEMKSMINSEINEAWDFAKKSPLPSGDTLLEFLFKEENHALV